MQTILFSNGNPKKLARLHLVTAFFCIAQLAISQEAKPSAGDFRSEFDKRLAAIQIPYDEREANLIESYKNRVIQIQEKFQEAGKLDTALVLKTEIEILNESGKTGTIPNETLEPLREIFSNEIAAILAEKSEATIKLHESFIPLIDRQVKVRTKQGDIESAKQLANLIQEYQDQIRKIKNAPTKKGELQSFSILTGDDAEVLLSSTDPKNNQAVSARATASSSWKDRDAHLVCRTERLTRLEAMNPTDFWSGTESTGWIRLQWRSPVVVREIILVNRPGESKADI